jgi:hypothetical protein
VKFGVWNMFNRVLYRDFVGDSSGNWQWLIQNNWRVANASVSVTASGFVNMGAYAIRGLDVDAVSAEYGLALSCNSSAVVASIGIGVNTAVTFSQRSTLYSSTNYTNATAKFAGLMGQGWSFVCPIEYVSNSAGALFLGNGTLPGQYQGGMHVEFWQ